MRKFPVYVLIDTSRFMAGEPIAIVRKIVTGYIARLRIDAYALEADYVSIISFGNDKAALVMPLTAISEFEPDSLNAATPSGARVLGDGLRMLEERYACEIRQTTETKLGDHRGPLFVYCGGQSRDAVESYTTFLDRHFATKATNMEASFHGDWGYRYLFSFNSKVSETYRPVFPEALLIDSQSVQSAIDLMYECHHRRYVS